jgi:hypothetical protein
MYLLINTTTSVFTRSGKAVRVDLTLGHLLADRGDRYHLGTPEIFARWKEGNANTALVVWLEAVGNPCQKKTVLVVDSFNLISFTYPNI